MDQEWDSYAETLNQTLEPQEEEGEPCNINNDLINIKNQSPNHVDVAVVQELNENNIMVNLDGIQVLVDQEVQDDYSHDMVNELPQPQGAEENWFDNVNNYVASDPLHQPPPDYRVPNDLQGYRNLAIDEQIVLVQQQQQQQQSDELALSEFRGYLGANFDYFYDLQQQEFEGGQHNSPGKRKNRSYEEDEFSNNNKKQQHTFGCMPSLDCFE